MSAKDFIKVALNILDKAVKLEKESKYSESIYWYEAGLEIMITTMKMPDCGSMLPLIKEQTKSFMKQAELVKDLIDKENSLDSLKLNPGQHQQIKIEKNSTGHSYQSIFNKFLVKGDVKEVTIEDPYIRDAHQVSNFVQFCEMLTKSRSKVRHIKLLTSLDKQKSVEQKEALESLRANLGTHGVVLTVDYSNNLHDREIRFDNGWIVKIGRGLDFFRRLPHPNMLGEHDFDFRQCLETTIDIFHQTTVCGD